MKKRTQHISDLINTIVDRLPEEQKRKILVERKIKQVHEQFAACVDPFILNHVNSVYLIKEETDVSRETTLELTTYVDNSTVAAELNAQRELIVLKYRELFGIKIDEFIIKISRGTYKENYPFKDQMRKKSQKFHRLSPEEEEEIRTQVSTISDDEIRTSFERLLKATKEHQIEE